MKKKIVISAFSLILIAALVFGAKAASAAQTPTNPFTNIIQKLAQKFGLKQSDVQQVFDDAQKERQLQAEKQYESMLSQAVKDGKLTQAQVDLILKKHKELISIRAEKQTNKPTLTPQQRKDAMQKEKDDLNAWASQNNVDVRYLFGGLGMWGKRGWGFRKPPTP